MVSVRNWPIRTKIAALLVIPLLAVLGPAAGPGTARVAPQRGQKANEGSQENPHAGQGAGRRCPQRGQNANPGDASKPQPAQVIRSPV